MRKSYDALKAALAKRFTPARLTTVQSTMFHQRRQGPDESVDEYAQELRKLFYKAYPPTYHGTPEAELLDRSVLSNQFVADLEPGLQKKLTGVEELVCKARFEEAKCWTEKESRRQENPKEVR